MRVALSLLLLVLAGCVERAPSLDAEYRAAENSLHSEQYQAAFSQSESGWRRAARQGDRAAFVRFRLLQAEVLLGERQASAALAALNAPPALSPESVEQQGREQLLRGRAAFYLARYADAGRFFDRAFDLARQCGSASLSAEVELRRALLWVTQNRFTESDAAIRGVIRSATALHDTYLEAAATGNLGYELLTASKYDQAIVWFERAKELHTRLGAAESIARDSGNLGWCYFRLGDFENARVHFESAQLQFARTGNRFEQQIWIGNTGAMLADSGSYAAAARAYRQALEIARGLQNDDWTSRWLGNLALTSIKLDDWEAARRYNNEALAIERRLGGSLFEATSLSNAGIIAFGQKRFVEAEQRFREALKKPREDPRVELDCRGGLAEVYARTGRPAAAEREYRAATAAIDRLNARLIKDDYKFEYLASLMDFYRQYVEFLMARGDPDRALQVAESSRSHVLEQRSGQPEPAAPRTVAAYQKLARDAHAVLLEYWLGRDQSYLWAITAQGIHPYRLPAPTRIRTLVEEYRGAVLGGRNPLDAAGEPGRKLFEALLAPAAESLRPDRRVILVPDQDLYSLNFESLPAGSDSSHFWIEKASVEIAPSLDYLVDAGRRRSAAPGKGLLVMGDPAPVLQDYPKLAFAAREIESIRAALGRTDSTVLEGAQARPESYADSHPGHFGFIHFSAHAAANPQSPLDSAVILSGPPDRCKLFARDVMAVPLTAELVTVSACRSAGARTYAGEGPVGLAWAFLRAGARNVIAGLWDVDDRSTAQLMAHLYAGMARGSTPAEALRAAKLALIHEGGSYAKPFYWAPFQLYAGAL